MSFRDVLADTRFLARSGSSSDKPCPTPLNPILDTPKTLSSVEVEVPDVRNTSPTENSKSPNMGGLASLPTLSTNTFPVKNRPCSAHNPFFQDFTPLQTVISHSSALEPCLTIPKVPKSVKDLIISQTNELKVILCFAFFPQCHEDSIHKDKKAFPLGYLLNNKDLQLLGEKLFFDKSISVPEGQSCAACHAQDAGWTGPDEQVNKTGGVYSGAMHPRFGNRKPNSAAYASLGPLFHAFMEEGRVHFAGGNFWDGRATGYKLGNPSADQAQGPFLNPVEQNIADAKIKLNEVEIFIKKYDKNILNLKKKINRNIEKSLIQFKDLNQIKLDQIEDNFKKAKEEYLEAKILFVFLTKGIIYKATGKDLKEFNTYVGGIADFCGELVRKARSESMVSEFSDVNIKRYKEVAMKIYEDLIEYSFSNSSGNRGKIEQLKGHIDAFDRILHDFNSKKAMKIVEGSTKK